MNQITVALCVPRTVCSVTSIDFICILLEIPNKEITMNYRAHLGEVRDCLELVICWSLLNVSNLIYHHNKDLALTETQGVGVMVTTFGCRRSSSNPPSKLTSFASTSSQGAVNKSYECFSCCRNKYWHLRYASSTVVPHLPKSGFKLRLGLGSARDGPGPGLRL